MADTPPGRNNRAITVAEREGLLPVPVTKGTRKPGMGTSIAKPIMDAATDFFASVKRLPNAANAFVSTVTGKTYFGPNQPLAPQAQAPEQGAIGRTFDYPFGWNLNVQPRQEDGGISFWQLRALAESCDVVKAAIQIRKDEIEAFDWAFVPINEDDDPDSPEFKKAIAENMDFWERPDKEHDWTSWLRAILDDLLIIDAVAIYPERTRGGGVYAMQYMDGAGIKRVINEYGRTPMPPDPAYQQMLKGFPAVDYTVEELFYTMRDPRTWKGYGNSPVEQLITTINLALRRTSWQMSYYTEGTVPEAIVCLPKEWTAEQIAMFQAYMDQLLTDNLGERRKIRFFPAADKLEFPKKEMLKDEFDDYLIRLVCFVFRVSPQALMKQMNRASAEQASDTAKEQGLMPTLRFLERQINRLNKVYRGETRVRFQWKIEDRVDPFSQAQTDDIYISAKVLTPDEVRSDRFGLPALSAAEREKAWPTPVPAPGAPGGAGGLNSKDDGFDDSSPVGKLLKRIRVQANGDPDRMVKLVEAHGEALVKAVRSLQPNVVELKPRVTVRVGDVRVEQPRSRSEPAE